ncbi:putative metalloprotease CJM1_0395 family protein [Halopseudomonas sp.]|uniref:putative metalloprotease CJM1_0395 family protein n=1 Tax=Halopseudomonas sp. TaxID=2901191 RepID=UPI0035634642
MSSIGSFLPSSFYSPSFSRAEPLRPTPADQQAPKSTAGTLTNTSNVPATNDEQVGGASSFSRVADSTGAAASEDGQREARVRQQLTGKEAELEMVEQTEIRELSARDREVRAHEQAHMAVGGQYAGAVSYDYSRGPDGRLYATGGSVSIDISPVAGDPAATIAKMQQVQRAALAPAEPSGADRAVAAQAAQMIAQARAEVATRNVQGESSAAADAPTDDEKDEAQSGQPTEPVPVASGTRELATYRQIETPALSEQAAFRASA